MAKVPTYARFLYLISELRKTAPDPDFEGCAEVLAFITVKESEGASIKITDLVQSLRYGTGPTVHRKIQELVKRRMINIVQSKADARAKTLTLAPPGLAYLKEMSQLMERAKK